MIIASPGNNSYMWCIIYRSYDHHLSIAPHSGVGGCAPKPRNERPLADNIAEAIFKVA